MGDDVLWSLTLPVWFAGLLFHPLAGGLMVLAPVFGLAGLVFGLTCQRPAAGQVGGVLGSLAVSQLFVLVARLLGGAFGSLATGIALAGFLVAQAVILPVVYRGRRRGGSPASGLTVFAVCYAVGAGYAAALAFNGVAAWAKA